MANINVKKLMQDETALFTFLRNSPQHAVVLSVIAGAIDLYHRILPRVVASHDLGLQQDISLIIRFMKREAHDRVAIRLEHSSLMAWNAYLETTLLRPCLSSKPKPLLNTTLFMRLVGKKLRPWSTCSRRLARSEYHHGGQSMAGRTFPSYWH